MSDVLDRLSPDVRLLLESSGPRLGFHGYYRLFGRDGDAPYTLSAWNDPNCWRFAWPSLSPTYCFFGASAWGDQYAIDVADLCRGVFSLDAFEMSEEVIAEDIRNFLTGEFARLDRAPYDSRVRAAYARFGALKWDEGLALVPPLLFAESEDACETIKTNMRSLMIANGDIYVQWGEMRTGETVAGMETYRDAAGRERIRLLRTRGRA